MRKGSSVLTAGTFRLLLVFAALVLSSVMIASVSGNAGFLSNLGRPVQLGPAVGYTLLFLIIVFFIAVLIMEVILFFIHVRTSKKGILVGGGSRSSFVTNSIIALAFIFSLVGLYFLLNSAHLSSSILNRSARPVTGNSTAPVIGFNGGSQFSSAIGLVLSVAIALILALAAIYVIVAIRPTGMHENEDEAHEKISQSIGQEIEKIRDSADPRAAILDSYRKMCSFLSSRGAEDKGWWTAREFEKRITERFGLQGKTVAEITSLFEEAKYSMHPLGGLERDRAVSLLEEIRKEIKEAAPGSLTVQ